jgi:hypothetical protein
MTNPNPTTDWSLVGERYYRKIPLYNALFDPDLPLGSYTITGAPYGGALALHRDESKLTTFRQSAAREGLGKESVDVYSSAGKLIRRIGWDREKGGNGQGQEGAGRIKGIGWSEDERLLVVTEGGVCRCYYDLQGEFTQFSLGHGSEEHGVVACRFWGSGFVALLGDDTLVVVGQYIDPRPRALAKGLPEWEVCCFVHGGWEGVGGE